MAVPNRDLLLVIGNRTVVRYLAKHPFMVTAPVHDRRP
jgi:hypothetical protein